MAASPFPPNPWGDSRRSRIGLLGGSFNPAHAGHLHISRIALAQLALDEIWWLVSPQNPLKSTAEMASLPNRVAEARKLADHPRLRVTALESHLGTRFTVDTLAALRKRFPRACFVWLMGADNLADLARWKRWTDVFRLVPVAVLPRPTYSFPALSGKPAYRYRAARIGRTGLAGLATAKPPAWAFLTARLHFASATRIRAERKAKTQESSP